MSTHRKDELAHLTAPRTESSHTMHGGHAQLKMIPGQCCSGE